MFELLQVGDRIIKADEIIPLPNYQLLPQLLRVLIDQAITSTKCVNSELCQQLYEQNQLTTETERQAAGTLWHEPRAIRSPSHTGTKIEKFKQETWGHKLGLLP